MYCHNLIDTGASARRSSAPTTTRATDPSPLFFLESLPPPPFVLWRCCPAHPLTGSRSSLLFLHSRPRPRRPAPATPFAFLPFAPCAHLRTLDLVSAAAACSLKQNRGARRQPLLSGREGGREGGRGEVGSREEIRACSPPPVQLLESHSTTLEEGLAELGFAK